MRIARSLTALAVAAAPVVAFSCGGSKQPAEVPPPAPSSSSEAASSSAPTAESSVAPSNVEATSGSSSTAGPPKPWEAMDEKERAEYMAHTILPKMKELFVAFKESHYSGMECMTCHGDGAKDKTFKMPNNALAKLDPKDGFKKHLEKKPAITKFMMEKVAPTMASLMGMPLYDPKTKVGFGCHNCHPMAGE